MKTRFIFLILMFFFVISCGQEKPTLNVKNPASKNTKQHTMDVEQIQNETVKNAIQALQKNDFALWKSYFTDDVIFTDDGRTLNFKSFFENAFEKKEKFLSIDKVENDGKNIEGNFFAGQWGTFKVFFNFYLNNEGKIERLDIGQSKK